MSMAEPFIPRPEQPGTDYDPPEVPVVPEDHGEPPEADETPTSSARANQGGSDA